MNQEYERLNELIARVEEMMKAEADGCSARVDIEGGALVFDKRLIWEPADGSAPMPFQSAPRRHRIIGAHHIMSLRSALAHERTTYRRALLEAIQKLEEALG